MFSAIYVTFILPSVLLCVDCCYCCIVDVGYALIGHTRRILANSIAERKTNCLLVWVVVRLMVMFCLFVSECLFVVWVLFWRAQHMRRYVTCFFFIHFAYVNGIVESLSSMQMPYLRRLRRRKKNERAERESI